MRAVALVRGALVAMARHAIPLLALSALAFALVRGALHAGPPTDTAHARTIVHFAWLYAGSAWIVQLMLVGAAARLVGRSLSQWTGARLAVVGFARGALPALAATAAVLVGGVALVLPGAALLVLLALAAASTAATVPGALVDSAQHVRRAPLAVLVVVIAMLAVDLGIAAIALHGVAAIPKVAKPPALATYRDVLGHVLTALALVSPLFACLLAQCYALTTPVLTAGLPAQVLPRDP